MGSLLSKAALLAVRAGILLVRSLPPYALLFCGAQILARLLPRAGAALRASPRLAAAAGLLGLGPRNPGKRWGVPLRALFAAWMAAEVIFLAWVRARAPRILASPLEPAVALDDAQRAANVARVQAAMRGDRAACTPREFLSAWFGGTPVEELRRGNVEDFLASNLYLRGARGLDAGQRASLARWTDEHLREWGLEGMRGGRNERARHWCVYTSEIRWCHKPLALYAALRAASEAGNAGLRLLGFQWHGSGCDTLSYAHWRNPDPGARGRPVVFVHGLGVGLLPYASLLRRLRALPSAPRHVFAVELRHISLRVDEPVPRSDSVVHAIESMLRRHGASGGAVFVGHSFGTIVTGWCLKQRGTALVSACLLADAVTFLQFLPKSVLGLLRSPPATAYDAVARFAVGRDLFMCRVLQRGVFWWESCTFAEELPRAGRCAVVLGGEDPLVPAEEVRRYLDGRCRVHFYPRLRHNGFLRDPEAMADVLAFVDEMVAPGCV